MQELITIEAQMLATGHTAVELRAPKYRDLRKARKLFPYDRPDRERLGYLPEDLMLASIIKSVNGKAVDEGADLIDRLGEMPLPDKQALSALVNELFYLSKERATLAAENAKEVRYEAYDFRTIPGEQMPSGKECKFKMPNTSVQIECEQNYPGIDKCGAGLEEYMFAYCIVNNDANDKLAGIDDWDIEDVQYAVNFYISCASLNEDTRVNLKKTARTLKQQLLGKPISMPTPKQQSEVLTPQVTVQQNLDEAEVQQLQDLIQRNQRF